VVDYDLMSNALAARPRRRNSPITAPPSGASALMQARRRHFVIPTRHLGTALPPSTGPRCLTSGDERSRIDAMLRIKGTETPRTAPRARPFLGRRRHVANDAGFARP
jgi:hypothetical protein